MMSDALLAQSAVDRLTSGAHTLIIEGPSYHPPTANADNEPTGVAQLTPPARPSDAHSHRQVGPMLLATEWSYHAGKVQR